MLLHTFLTTLLAAILLWSCNSRQAPVTQSAAEAAEATAPQTQNPYYSRTDTSKLRISDAEWKKVLPEAVYYIARQKGTERAFSGKFWNHTGIGAYYCAACGNALFRSDLKFESDCGWPSFFEPLRKNAVLYKPDNSIGMQRIEVLCGRCDGHLGHVFDDGPPPTGKRFCINSLVLHFEPGNQLLPQQVSPN